MLTDVDKIADEAMSFWKPRKTKTGGLPHCTFEPRKPNSTDFKNVANGTTGVCLHLEIMEGAEFMKSTNSTTSRSWAGRQPELSAYGGGKMRTWFSLLWELLVLFCQGRYGDEETGD